CRREAAESWFHPRSPGTAPGVRVEVRSSLSRRAAMASRESNQRRFGQRAAKRRPGAPWLALALAGLLATGAAAQETGQVTGMVTDGSGIALSEVQVYLVGPQLGSLTRSNGRFVILNVPAGTYELRAERIGFRAAAEEVTVTAGS